MKKYKYFVEWLEEDKKYVGLCEEFPSLSWLDKNKEKALFGIKALVNETLEEKPILVGEKPDHISQEDWDSVEFPELTEDDFAKMHPASEVMPELVTEYKSKNKNFFFIRNFVDELSIKVSPLSEKEGGGFLATVEQMDGCMTDGETLEEALDEIKDAIKAWQYAELEELKNKI